ncbi:MAG TPA: GNAT family N-acetyltransferase [Acidisarcina sp.]
MYYRPGYVRAYEKAGAARSVAVVVSALSSQFLIPLEVRSLTELRFTEQTSGYDAITPYGYGGILRLAGPEEVDYETTAALCSALRHWCIKNDIVSILLRLHPLLNQARWFHRAPEGVLLLPYGPTVGLDLDAWDYDKERLKGLTRGRRADLNFAHRNLRLTWASNSPEEMNSHLRHFRTIYEQRMGELDADKSYFFPPEYYAALVSGLGNNVDIAVAWHGEQVVGGGIYLAGNQFAHAHLTGTNEAGRFHRANTLLINEAARWGRRRGCRWLHLGGGKSGDNALFEYKKSFGGALFDYSFVGLIADEKRYVRLTQLRSIQGTLPPPRLGYFPQYRA